MMLLDTDVISFLFKRDTRVVGYLQLLEGEALSISFMTLAELYQWAYVRNWGQPRIERLETWLRRFAVLCRVMRRFVGNGHLCASSDANRAAPSPSRMRGWPRARCGMVVCC